MVVIKYVGKTSDLCGKILWDIVGNLKNFGVGRVIVRSSFQRYPEKSFYRILSVVPDPAGDVYDIRKVNVIVEKTFRGLQYPKPASLYSSSFKPDFRLLSKEEEAEFCQVERVHQLRKLPNKVEMPPILKKVVFREFDKKGMQYDKNMKLEIKPKNFKNQFYEFVEADNEEYFTYELDLSKTPSPNLYKDLNISKQQQAENV